MARKAAGPAGQSVYMFFNRPSTAEYVDASGADLTRGYDVYTAQRHDRFSVAVHYDSIAKGDLAVVYRFSDMPALAGIAAVARIRSGGLTDATGFRHIRWDLLRLPPELILTRDEFLADPRWHGRTPFVAKQRARGPIELSVDDWNWMSARLPAGAITWLVT